MDYREYIESNINIMLGKPVIKGTRITVALILQRLSEGATIANLVEAYPSLSPVAITAALAYASDVIDNESIIAVA
ncbi:DUF433 domain-containing protein [Chitinophaga oryzae]|uniref:DUF433 domain-containing protein n=1 Tax=Chitinophaga oryzae TaxID=2725414 RepID=A0AAE7D939_9BACT|nr:DUF433 domain-containing protein [Chitinophaga oryzae]QJB34038.1 DUF433 domain-containing protein [Chitinophaga oryzae]QJB40566.1 DUF433 domain-containing protein [Chitinophaga oryzae]